MTCPGIVKLPPLGAIWSLGGAVAFSSSIIGMSGYLEYSWGQSVGGAWEEGKG